MLPPELQPRSFRPYIASRRVTILSSLPTPAITVPNPIFFIVFSSGRRSASNRSLKNSRFSSSAFAHNARVTVALVPCTAFLLDLGGTPVVTAITLGLMIAYILDSLSFKPGPFFAVWFFLIATQIAFFFSSSLVVTFNSVGLGVLSAFTCAITNFLIGTWISLQFFNFGSKIIDMRVFFPATNLLDPRCGAKSGKLIQIHGARWEK